MKKLIFLDCETTGLEEEDRLIQLAYKVDDIVVDKLFKPSKRISIGAMAVHHITEEMVKDCEVFDGSETKAALSNLLEQSFTLIAHNASFDIKMLEREGMGVENFICTFKIAKFLDKDEKIESYSLQYLRYLLELDKEIDTDITAHDALGDILVLEKLFERLFTKMSETMEVSNEEVVLEEMIRISSEPALIRSFKFGKHKGRKLEEVVQEDRGYLEWLYGQKTNESEPDEDWIYTLKYYLKLP